MTRDEERELLANIRVTAEALPAEYSLGADAKEGLCLFGPATDGDGHETYVRFEAGCPFLQQQAFLHLPRNLRFLLGLLDRASASVRTLRQRLERYEPPPTPEPKKKDYAAEVTMKCQTGAFRRFLIECHGLPDTADLERTLTRIRTLLRIESRSELNTDPDAQARWKSLKQEFERWMKR